MTPFALAAMLFVALPSFAAAGSLSGVADDLSDWVEDGLDRLRDEADRAARKRVNALHKVDRLLARDHEDLVAGLVTTRRVASVLGRGFRDVDAEAEEARALVGDLLDELDGRYDDLSTDAQRAAEGLTELLPDVSRRAATALALASRLALRADGVSNDVRRARLLERAARQVRRVARQVKKKGGVVGPYTCYESETGTAAGIVHIVSDALGAVSATNVDGLLTVTSRDVVSALRLDAVVGGTTVRLAFPPITFDGVGAYEIGPAVGQARAEVEVAGVLSIAQSGTLSVDAYDLAAKTLSGRFDLVLGPDETVSGVFTICDILVAR